MVPAVAPQKPSTARYCEVLQQREALLNAFADHRGDRSHFVDGSWLITLATLEFELAFHTSNDDDVHHWVQTAYGRGVHQFVDLDSRSRAATRLIEIEERSSVRGGDELATAVFQ